MRLRTLLVLALAALVGAAVAVLPALAAAPSEVKLEVNENCVENHWPCWTDASGSNPAPALKVMVAVGGEIKFADKANTAATVSWTGTEPMCSNIPASAMTNWEGSCKFEQSGTYHFESPTLFDGGGSENYTKYEIVVESATSTTSSTTSTTTTPTSTTTSTTTTPTSTTTNTPTTTTTPTATTSTQTYGGGASTVAGTSTPTTSGSTVPTETPSPPSESHSLALALASTQHGDAVHGTVQIPAADDGARLEVELLAQGASLAKVMRASSSRVGRLVRFSAPAGKVSFTVPLDPAAKRALRTHHKLALILKIVLTPKHGATVTLTRSVTLR